MTGMHIVPSRDATQLHRIFSANPWGPVAAMATV